MDNRDILYRTLLDQESTMDGMAAELAAIVRSTVERYGRTDQPMTRALYERCMNEVDRYLDRVYGARQGDGSILANRITADVTAARTDVFGRVIDATRADLLRAGGADVVAEMDRRVRGEIGTDDHATGT